MLSFEQFIPKIIKSLRSAYGEEFFNMLTLQLNDIIGADYTFIAKLNKEKYTSETISLVAGNAIADNFEYSLTGTPCADVSDNSICVYPKNLTTLYPGNQLFTDTGVEGYVGIPLHDSQGDVIGIVVALYKKEIENSKFVSTLFDFFSGRIAAEIERTENEKQLSELNETLELRVAAITVELSQALAHVKQSQDLLIEQEKMASLGSLVAGVTHDINTPLGIAILSTSYIDEIISNLDKEINSESLTKKSLETSVGEILEAQKLVSFNLQRAADLVQNFKQVAIERNLDELQKFSLKPWLEALVTSLSPMFKKQNINFYVHFDDDDIKITSFPAKLSQVLTNLISNAVIHGFIENSLIKNKTIEINIHSDEHAVAIHVADNGIGIPKDIEDKIYQPFFTTNRIKGSTGLGLSIISNIIAGNLSGNIKLNHDGQPGAEFIITLPIELKPTNNDDYT